MVRSDSDIAGPDDLGDKTVCATVGGVPEQRMAKEHPEAELVSGDELTVVGQPFSEDHCGIGLPKGEVELRGAVNDAVELTVDRY
ncbi:hypothetical protein [Brevibacterium sp. UCMA 11754]|uniref:hypothetical protein n=1 Tax=Brevibacterium sp. UCMA 11754 TaxID=2749198 RepID=UPI001F2874AA|nr:hypothetical protein [Brevibacterium sp. UCMA 11754]MCF2571365.1 hypothetical protein [Brevibacterium sp. UCMA 11754]